MNFLKQISSRWTLPVMASSLCLIAQSPSEALQFNFSYEEGTPYEQMLGFEVAGNWWASQITDDVTLNIHVGTSNSLPKNVVGGALPSIKAFRPYGKFQSKLQQDISFRSDDDTDAVYRGGPDDYRDNRGNTYYKGQLESTAWDIYKTSLTSANSKAVSMTHNNSKELDGMIMLSDLSSTLSIKPRNKVSQPKC